jgi:hypothetical protein
MGRRGYMVKGYSFTSKLPTEPQEERIYDRRTNGDFSPRGWPAPRHFAEFGIRRGQVWPIPSIRIGKLLRVPVKALERMLDPAGANSGQQRELINFQE